MDSLAFRNKSPLGMPGIGPFEALPDVIARQAAAQGLRQALVGGDERLGWSDFAARIDAVAVALSALGLSRGDNVALLGPLSIAAVTALFGILRAGACVVPLPTTAADKQLEAMARDANVRVVLAADGMRGRIGGAHVPSLLPGGLCDLDGFGGACDAHAAIRISPDDTFNIIYSSGTTGNPKGIVYDHAMRWFQATQTASSGVDERSVCLLSTPLYSNTTLAGGLLQVLAAGGSLVLMRKFEVREFIDLCRREKVTHATLVPVQCQRLLACPELDGGDLSGVSLRVTAAPLSQDLKRQLARRWPGPVFESYGFTELGAGCVLDLKAFPDKLHTVGRPKADVEFKVIDDKGRELPPGATGELVGRACTMMRGYHGKAGLTAQILWRDTRGLAYLRSGDLAKIDEDGFVVLLDRKKDVIISGGFNIYPADLEAVLAAHEDVAEVAVIGVPSEEWGESPLAIVVPRAQAVASAAQLREWANARLGKTQRLAAIEFRDHLPRGALGKLLKRNLRDAYWTGSGRRI